MRRRWWLFAASVPLIAGLASMVRVTTGGRRPVATQAVAPAAVARAFAVPVRGFDHAELRSDWGDPRDGGARGHHGTDLAAPALTPVVAAVAGRVEKLHLSARGGLTVYLRSADRRWTCYYAHLAGYAQGLREGQAVRAGTVLGFVGDTGDAGAGNYHLHFGLARMRPGERWWQGTDVDPYPSLAAGRLPRY